MGCNNCYDWRGEAELCWLCERAVCTLCMDEHMERHAARDEEEDPWSDR